MSSAVVVDYENVGVQRVKRVLPDSSKKAADVELVVLVVEVHEDT